MFNIRRIRKFLNHETAQILVSAFVTSRLDYCNSLLYGLPATQLKTLQRVQNAAARLICNISRFDHTTSILFELHWLPYRVNFKTLPITYKALHGLAPNYITELITVKPLSRYSLRSDNELFLQRPTIKSSATLGDCSFALAAPTLWNELSASHGDAPYQLNFKVDFQSVLRRLNGSVQNVDPLLDRPSGPLVDPVWTHLWTPFFLHPVKKIIAWQMLGTLCVKGCGILKI